MKISVITVCFNSELTILETIKSVAAQTYKNLEYIVVDGNSKDATLEIIKNHDTVITKWISEPDKGLYDAMNKGIFLATGDVIGILNSDDTFSSDSVLSEIAAFHMENCIDVSTGNILQHKKNRKAVRLYSSKDWVPEKLKIGFMPPHPSIFFKRSLFERFGNYSLDYQIGSDYELIVRFFLKNNVSWKYSTITTHKMLIGGLSSSGLRSYNVISKEIQKGLEANNIPFENWKIIFRFTWKLVGFFKR
jgi:glycosyltransferase involved in cell wall biosynthesis